MLQILMEVQQPFNIINNGIGSSPAINRLQSDTDITIFLTKIFRYKSKQKQTYKLFPQRQNNGHSPPQPQIQTRKITKQNVKKQ